MFRDFLDGLAANTVRTLYLLGLSLSIFAFFSGVALEYDWLKLVVGAALAVALVIHEFLAQRRVQSLLGRVLRCRDADVRAGLWQQFGMNATILGLLVVFDMFNVTEYVAETALHNPFVPGAVMVVVRGLALPLFYLLSSFLIDVEDDAGIILSKSANKMLLTTVRATMSQWSARIEDAKRQGVNLTTISATLMEDAGELDAARRVRLIENGLKATETGTTSSRNMKSQTSSVQKTSPTKASVVKGENEGGNAPSNVVRLAGRGGYRVRRQLKEQERVFKFLNEHPDASIAEVRRGAKLGSDNTAIKYRKMWREMNGLSAVAEG